MTETLVLKLEAPEKFKFISLCTKNINLSVIPLTLKNYSNTLILFKKNEKLLITRFIFIVWQPGILSKSSLNLETVVQMLNSQSFILYTEQSVPKSCKYCYNFAITFLFVIILSI